MVCSTLIKSVSLLASHCIVIFWVPQRLLLRIGELSHNWGIISLVISKKRRKPKHTLFQYVLYISLRVSETKLNVGSSMQKMVFFIQIIRSIWRVKSLMFYKQILKIKKLKKKKTNSSFSKIFDWLKTISLTTCCNWLLLLTPKTYHFPLPLPPKKHIKIV